jgi:transcriptional regulator with XRE-family HTH domain
MSKITGIGSRVRSARELKGFTQYELAQRCGVRDLAISQTECGKTIPKAELLVDLARELDLSVDWILTGVGEGPRREVA